MKKYVLPQKSSAIIQLGICVINNLYSFLTNPESFLEVFDHLLMGMAPGD